MNNTECREALVGVMKEMDARKLNHGTAGNAALRFGDKFFITPSGIPPCDLTPDAIVLLDFDGTYEGFSKPSSEWRMHGGILKHRQDINAIVHCHSRFATTLACANMSIPPLHYMTAMSGRGEVQIAPYAVFGSQELADNIVETLDGHFACLMANHGQIAVAPDLSLALAVADEMEVQASYYWGSLAIGGPKILQQEQIEEVLKRFRAYGQRE